MGGARGTAGADGGAPTAAHAARAEAGAFSLMNKMHEGVGKLCDALSAGKAAGGDGCAVPAAASRDAATALNHALFTLVLKPRMKSAAYFEDYPGKVLIPGRLWMMVAAREKGARE